VWACAAVALLAAGPQPARAQVPSPAEAQSALDRAARQNPQLPDLIRSRIRESGMTPEQIRSRLRAGGYPENLLDPYLGTPAPGEVGPTPGTYELTAIGALGIPLSAPGLAVDTGFLATPGAGLPRSDVFGIDVFRRTTTQFLPVLSGPVPPDYRLGAGDVLVLILTGDVELAYTLQVTRSGFIVVPQVGQLFVANLTLDALKDLLFARLGRVYSGVRRSGATTQFDITVTGVRAIQVFVTGDVVQPGAYQISALGTVLTALYAAGGLEERGNTRAILLRRGDSTVAAFDLYDYLLRGDTRNDIRLENGDVVFVGVRGPRVAVSGAVIRPAIYEIKGGETLAEMVAASGGLTASASVREILVRRIVPGRERTQEATARVVIRVPLSPPSPARERGTGGVGLTMPPFPPSPATERGTGGVGSIIPPFPLEDGDSVEILSLPDAPEAYFVAIAGMVQRPGQYPWREGMTLRELVRLAQGPRVGAYLQEAEIARLPADRSAGQMAATVRVPLDSSYILDRDSAGRYIGAPGLPFPAGGSAAEVALQPFDNVLILRQPDFELQRTVTITGEVRFPGSYALRAKNERLSDLLQRAGGLTAQAYPEGIRFYRALNDAGRLNISLGPALTQRNSRDNVILQPGDSIDIPEYVPSVRVTGAVNAPGSVLWRRGAGLAYYISAAGGYARNADDGRTSVRYANGEVRTKKRSLILFASSPTPDPGAEVFVPGRDPSDKKDWASIVGILASTASLLASTAAVIIAVTR
jgi:protein involved in polysaccharide export with SLBB domain